MRQARARRRQRRGGEGARRTALRLCRGGLRVAAAATAAALPPLDPFALTHSLTHCALCRAAARTRCLQPAQPLVSLPLHSSSQRQAKFFETPDKRTDSFRRTVTSLHANPAVVMTAGPPDASGTL
jgi:hypothetical protein